MEYEKYKLKEIIQPRDDSYDEIIAYLLEIIQDRTIHEESKRDVQKQFNEIMRLKSITMKPPVIILELKDKSTPTE